MPLSFGSLSRHDAMYGEPAQDSDSSMCRSYLGGRNVNMTTLNETVKVAEAGRVGDTPTRTSRGRCTVGKYASCMITRLTGSGRLWTGGGQGRRRVVARGAVELDSRGTNRGS